MEIKVFLKGKIEYLKVTEFTTVSVNDNLFLVLTYNEEIGNSSCSSFKFFKVQYITICKTQKNESLNVVYYLNEGGSISHVVLDDNLNGDYCSLSSGTAHLIDYDSYVQICELTNQVPNNFMEYVISQIQDDSKLNYLLQYEGKFYNFDEAQDLIDSKKNIHSPTLN